MNNSLEDKSLKLAKEWHPTKNKLSPSQISYSSNKKFWWICEKGHEWLAAVGNRYRGTRCPYCSGKKASPEYNLAIANPSLVKQWHPIRNGALTPHDVTPGCKQTAWWMCAKGHEWEAKISNRYSSRTDCPFCNGKVTTKEYNLEVNYPNIAKQWHPRKNGILLPNQVTPRSSKAAWWMCAKGHKWRTTVQARVRGQGCIFCLGRKPTKVYNFYVLFPELAKEWHKEKNDPLTPYDVTPGGKKKIWWICKYGHEWQSPTYSRTKGHGCPKCNYRCSQLEIRIYCELKYIFSDVHWKNKLYKKEVDIYIQELSLAIEVDGWYWHKSKERRIADENKYKQLKLNGITLLRVYDDRLVNVKGHHLIPFKKGEHDHGVIISMLNHIKKMFTLNINLLNKINKYLQENSYQNQIMYNEIKSCLPGPLFQDSVSNNTMLLKEWDYTKNSLSPMHVHIGTKNKVFWLCEKNHSWLAIPSSRVKGSVCPYCSGKKASPEYNLAIANLYLVKQWHPIKNGALKPNEVTPKSNKAVWWMCDRGHEWKATIDNRARGTNCPECCERKLSPSHNLAIKFPELVKQWHYEKNYPLTPCDVTPKSFLKVWWRCKSGHIWQARVEKRTRGRGCHVCAGQWHLLK